MILMVSSRFQKDTKLSIVGGGIAFELSTYSHAQVLSVAMQKKYERAQLAPKLAMDLRYI